MPKRKRKFKKISKRRVKRKKTKPRATVKRPKKRVIAHKATKKRTKRAKRTKRTKRKKRAKQTPAKIKLRIRQQYHLNFKDVEKMYKELRYDVIKKDFKYLSKRVKRHIERNITVVRTELQITVVKKRKYAKRPPIVTALIAKDRMKNYKEGLKNTYAMSNKEIEAYITFTRERRQHEIATTQQVETQWLPLIQT